MIQQVNPSHARSRWTPDAAPIGRPPIAGPAGLIVDRPLGRRPLGTRWLLRDPDNGAPSLGFRIDDPTAPRSDRAFHLAGAILTSIDHRHILSPTRLELGGRGDPWLVADYPCDYDGVRTLEAHAAACGGSLPPLEVRALSLHLLAALEPAHGRGIAHGPMDAGEVLLDRRGAAMVELLGLARRLRGRPVADAHDRADDVRSALALSFRALCGAPWDDGQPSRIEAAIRADEALGRWLETGLCSIGFATAEEAMAAAPGPGSQAAGVARVGWLGAVRHRLAL